MVFLSMAILPWSFLPMAFYRLSLVSKQEDTRYRPNAGLLLDHRLRCRPYVKPALYERIVVAGLVFL